VELTLTRFVEPAAIAVGASAMSSAAVLKIEARIVRIS
jgi:hypothetical protein